MQLLRGQKTQLFAALSYLNGIPASRGQPHAPMRSRWRHQRAPDTAHLTEASTANVEVAAQALLEANHMQLRQVDDVVFLTMTLLVRAASPKPPDSAPSSLPPGSNEFSAFYQCVTERT
ncbi:hypothetical protein RBI14_17100 [Alcaligenaceae bacterium B3P038]|nr:hypothetical protein [Alcaligenaceae bacterium B3P038]